MILHLAVGIRARPGQERALTDALRALVAPSRADDGCIVYDLHVDRDDPGHLFLYEAWRDVPAWEAHMATPHLAAFLAQRDELVASLDLVKLTRLD
jgi:quinol monooxygenase YgiN